MPAANVLRPANAGGIHPTPAGVMNRWVLAPHLPGRSIISGARTQPTRLARLNHIDGIDLPANAIDRRPSIDIDILQNPQRLEQFLAVWDWYLDEVRKANTG